MIFRFGCGVKYTSMSRVTVAYVGVLCILAWLAILHGTSLWGFSEGYLKTRAHLDRHSECGDVKDLYTLPDKSYLERLGRNESCWNHRKFERVVVLLVDSLRFDFCTMDPSYDPSSEPSFATGHAYVDPGDDARIVRYYKNRLPIINATIWEKPKNARLFRFVADPPTATMQRIKALTTGSMPTFLEVSDNFASEEIKDDNWVVQMGNCGRKAVFVGDDTWMSMYPRSFAKAYPYPSFEVRDLHTVDLGVQKHLIPEIKGESFGPTGWHLILGHMLGVDHVGHRLGSNHPEMASKLQEMNMVISQTMKHIDDGTLFIVLSDHGMNYEGNHGGATFQEQSASLFFYTPRKDAFKDPVEEPLPNASNRLEYKHVSQIDIVPTLSMLLGAPIPYGSLGMILPDLFWSAENPSDLLDPLHVNSAQLLRYLSDLEKNGDRFPEEEMKALRQSHSEAVESHARWQSDYKSSNFGSKNANDDSKNGNQASKNGNSDSSSSKVRADAAREVYKKYKKFHEHAVDLCRRLWTTFDTDKMQLNLWFMIATTLVPAVLALANSKKLYRIMFYVSVGLFWAPLTYLVGWKSRGWPLSLEWIIFVIQVSSLGSALLALIVEFEVFFPHFSISSVRRWVRTRLDFHSALATTLFFALLGFRCFSATSNSFIIHAQMTNTFLTSSLIALLALISWRNGQPRVASFLVIALVFNRITYQTFAGAHENYFSASTFFGTAIYTVLPMLAILYVSTLAVRKWLNADLRLFLLYVLPFVLLALYWIVQASGALESEWAWVVRILVPRSLFASSLIHLFYVVIMPFVKYSSIFKERPGVALADSTDGGMTEFFTRDGRHFSVHSVKFLTRANFVRVGLASLPSLMIILGPASPLPILALLVTSISVASAATSALQVSAPKPRLSLLALSCLLWSFLAYTYFYATSHLPVLTALQMSAGFIGIDHFSLYYGGFLVIFNSFFSHFILALAAPILGCNLFHFDEQQIHKSTLIYNFIYSATATATCATSYMHRRHLFVWTVFAPFFLFESAGLIFVDVGLILGTLVALAASRQTAPQTVMRIAPSFKKTPTRVSVTSSGDKFL